MRFRRFEAASGGDTAILNGAVVRVDRYASARGARGADVTARNYVTRIASQTDRRGAQWAGDEKSP